MSQDFIIGAVRTKTREPPHHELLQELLAKASPPVGIEAVSQRWHADLVEINKPVTITVNLGDGKSATIEAMRTHKDQGSGLVQFSHAGRQHGFMYSENGSWMDVDAVVNAFNRFMAELNRPDRVYQFAKPREESGEHRAFVVADARRFPQAAERLALPL
jgi:phosphoribosylformylglycinamidine (FGAM) synthase-like amidotransferase family enzyme